MPIAGRGTVNITLPAAGRVTLGLFDRMGRRVMLIADAPMRSGTTTLPLDLAALPTGVYELTASLDDAASSNLQQQTPAIRFTVRDTGPGIRVEDLAHVFDWFWRSPAGRDGAGLGLGIAKGLIEAHGGHLRAESTLGVGSTFWFTLPALTRTRPPTQPSE